MVKKKFTETTLMVKKEENNFFGRKSLLPSPNVRTSTIELSKIIQETIIILIYVVFHETNYSLFATFLINLC